MSKVDGMTPDEAAEMILNVLGDRPSGPDPREVLAVIQAEAWAEGHGVGRTDEWCIEPNPYRSQA